MKATVLRLNLEPNHALTKCGQTILSAEI